MPNLGHVRKIAPQGGHFLLVHGVHAGEEEVEDDDAEMHELYL